MFRVSVKNSPNGLHLKLEGKLVPPWTNELESIWQQLVAGIGSKKIHLDLCGTTFVDRQGMHLLQLIVQAANPEITADSPLTRQFAQQARCKTHA